MMEDYERRRLEEKQALEKRKAKLIKKWTGYSRRTKVQLLKAVTNYRSGTDSINTVYMGGMAHGMLVHALGGRYGQDSYDYLFKKATDKQLNVGLESCWSYIDYMLQNPTEKCPCCGQIVPKKRKK